MDPVVPHSGVVPLTSQRSPRGTWGAIACPPHLAKGCKSPSLLRVSRPQNEERSVRDGVRTVAPRTMRGAPPLTARA